MTPESSSAAPRVSVVIPSFNRRALLGEALDSVLAQEGVAFEVIVVDDGSTDGTGEFLRERAAQAPALRHATQRNAGPSAARNRGVAMARGAYVAFLDSDDLFLPGNLAAQTALLDAHPEADLALCDVRFVGAWKRRTGLTMFTRKGWLAPTSLAAMARGASGAPSSMMLRATVARALPFDEGLVWYEDADFLFRFHRAGHRLVLNPRVLAAWRHVPHDGEERLSSAAPERALEARIQVLRRYVADATEPAAARLFLHRLEAKECIRQGRWREARRHLWACWRRRPLELHTLRKLLRSCLAPGAPPADAADP